MNTYKIFRKKLYLMQLTAETRFQAIANAIGELNRQGIEINRKELKAKPVR